MLSSFVRWPETEVARLIFHELAHQLLYVKNDSVFNESFATAVEEAGLARWLAARKDPQLAQQAARTDRLRAQIPRSRPHDAREALRDLRSTAVRRRQAARQGGSARGDEGGVRQREGRRTGPRRLRSLVRAQPNNAALAAIGIYTDRVPAFRELLHETNDDLPRFYERVRALAALPKRARDAELDALSARAAAASMSARHGRHRRSRLIRNGIFLL